MLVVIHFIDFILSSPLMVKVCTKSAHRQAIWEVEIPPPVTRIQGARGRRIAHRAAKKYAPCAPGCFKTPAPLHASLRNQRGGKYCPSAFRPPRTRKRVPDLLNLYVRQTPIDNQEKTAIRPRMRMFVCGGRMAWWKHTIFCLDLADFNSIYRVKTQ